MIWKTKLTHIHNGIEQIRGNDLSQLIREKSFVEVVFLLWIGRLPNQDETTMLNALFVACVDHGVGAPSATVARTVASTGNSAHTSLAAGISALGDLHGGAIEGAATFLRDHKEADIHALVADLKTKKNRIPGFGHKILEKDTRVTALFDVAKTRGFYGTFCQLAEKIEHELTDLSSKPIPLNIDGGMAAILLDMGINPDIAMGFFLAGRVPGLIAHIYEEKLSGAGIRRIAEADIEHQK